MKSNNEEKEKPEAKLKERALEFHIGGKLRVNSKVEINKDTISLAYTPGVAMPCIEIAKNKEDVYKYTSKGNMVAVITDGSAVLGLGDIGPEASLPVMEGKSLLFKHFADIDAFPIALKTKDVDEIVNTIKLISPMFGGVNLEDISAPRCFEIEERLKRELDIPVFHDDQHGTAIVVCAALINASKVVDKKISDLKIVINGAGAAGTATAKLLLKLGVKDLILLDSVGIISKDRSDLNKYKKEIAEVTNNDGKKGDLKNAMKSADVFIGLSKAGLVSKEMVRTMNNDPIIIAMANPVPEIMPDEAKEAGAKCVGTGRSDFPNQINNVLAFPGVFRGVLDERKKQITDDMKLNAAKAIASLVKNPSYDCFIPSVFDKKIVEKVAEAVKR